MDELSKLKVEAYDKTVQMQKLQQELIAINQKIVELENPKK